MAIISPGQGRKAATWGLWKGGQQADPEGSLDLEAWPAHSVSLVCTSFLWGLHSHCRGGVVAKTLGGKTVRFLVRLRGGAGIRSCWGEILERGILRLNSAQISVQALNRAHTQGMGRSHLEWERGHRFPQNQQQHSLQFESNEINRLLKQNHKLSSEQYNGIQSLYNITFATYMLQSESTQHTKSQGGVNHPQGKDSQQTPIVLWPRCWIVKQAPHSWLSNCVQWGKGKYTHNEQKHRKSR